MQSSRRRLLGAGALILGGLQGCGGGGGGGGDSPPANAQELPLPANPTPWQADLQDLVGVLLASHPQPFKYLERSLFMADARALMAAMPGQSEAQNLLGLHKLFARLRDGHTRMEFDFRRVPHPTMLPLFVESFEEGLFVISTEASAAELSGAEVLAFGGRPASEALAQMGRYWPVENRWGLMDRGAAMLRSSLVLADAGFSTAPDRAQLTLRLRSGATVQREVPAGNWNSFQPAFSGTTVRRYRQSSLAYWHEWIPAVPESPQGLALYLRYKRCENIDAFSALVRSITADARWTQLSRVVVDLRGNYGGSSSVYRPFLEACRGNPAAMRPGAFQVLTDRATMSAAIEALLESKAIGARSLGEPTGQRPNFMANLVPFTSSRLQLAFVRATLYYDRVSGDPDTLAPDVQLPYNFSDWLVSRDTVLERALA